MPITDLCIARASRALRDVARQYYSPVRLGQLVISVALWLYIGSAEANLTNIRRDIFGHLFRKALL